MSESRARQIANESVSGLMSWARRDSTAAARWFGWSDARRLRSAPFAA